MIRPLLRLSTWRVDNESPSMAGASPAHFLSPVMSISSRTINLGNNTESQHLRSYYVHQYRLAEREKKWGLKTYSIWFLKKLSFVNSNSLNALIVNVSCKQAKEKTQYPNPTQTLKGKDPIIQAENETFAVVIGSIKSIFNFLNFNFSFEFADNRDWGFTNNGNKRAVWLYVRGL